MRTRQLREAAAVFRKVPERTALGRQNGEISPRTGLLALRHRLELVGDAANLRRDAREKRVDEPLLVRPAIFRAGWNAKELRARDRCFAELHAGSKIHDSRGV